MKLIMAVPGIWVGCRVIAMDLPIFKLGAVVSDTSIRSVEG